MSLSDFDVPRHPSEFEKIKYLPYEILKIQKKGPRNSQIFDKEYDSELAGFETVESEEISEDQQIQVTRIVDEITSVRSREIRPGVIENEEKFLEVKFK